MHKNYGAAVAKGSHRIIFGTIRKENTEILQEKTKRIISENTVQIIEKINTITSLEFEEIYFLKFIQLIKEIDIKIFDSIVDKLDYQQIEKNFNKGFIYKGKAKQIQKRKNQFDKLIKQNL